MHEVHAWVYTWSDLPSPGMVDTLYSLLCAEERRRYHRFYFERDRHSYLLAHALLRLALSHYRPVHPRDWTFAAEDHGKPFVVAPAADAPKFNLTHSAGIVACVISEHMEVGIDAENMARRHSPMEVARAVFAPSELRSLEQAPESCQSELFFTYWTLKEAYVKARGFGLSLPLDQFAFSVEPTLPPTIVFHPEFLDNPADWQFRLFRPDQECLLSVAVQSRGAPVGITLNSAAQMLEAIPDYI